MPQSPAEIVMNLLASKAVGVIGSAQPTDWRLATGKLTEDPPQQICCYDSPGGTPSSKWLLDYPFVQVLVRSPINGYREGRQKIQDAYDVLLGLPPTLVPGAGNVDAITVVGTPSFIGNDVNERPLFSANFRLIFEPVQSSLSNREPL